MTGTWLFVKWVGTAILWLYLALIVAVFWRFRGRLSRLRPRACLPIVLGNCIGGCVPSIFEDVVLSRVCFVTATVVYLFGIAVLLRGLSADGHKIVLKDEDIEEEVVQSLKLS